MSLLRRFAGGIRGLLRKDRIERELDEELRGFLDAAIAEGMRAGMSREDAIRAARMEMGSLDAVKEEVRAVGWETALDTVWRDVRHGARVLRNHPGFACAAILTLALGIGANTAIFSVVSTVLLKPLPYPDPDRLVTLPGGQSLPDLMDLAERSTTFEALGASAGWALDLVGEGEPQRIDGELVAGDLFRALGVQALLGRTFSEADDRARAPVVVVSHEFWRAHLASDRAAVGRQLNLSGAAYTVIAVMPRGFRLPFFAFKSQIWIPFRTGYPEGADARGAHFLLAVARLRDGASLGDARTELEVIGRRIGELNPTEARDFTAEDLRDHVVGGVRTPLLILLGAVSLVLLIACSNFASLLLARGVARRREMQVRHALGASRGRLVRQLVTESAVLSILGGGAGVLLASRGVDLLVRLMPTELPSFHHVAIDSRTMIYTLLVSVATGLVFGVAPALHLCNAGAVRPSGARSTEGRSSLWRALVIAELALATVLLIGAGLLIRSYWHLRSVALGFEPDRVLTFRLTLPASRYEPIPAQESFLARLDQGLRASPGVAAAGLVSELPLAGWRMLHNMIVEGQAPVPEGREPEVHTHEVSPDYFVAMGTPLRRGRGFTDQDGPTSPLVGVVNEAFVRRFLPDRDPLGARARWARGEPDAWMTIVGVAADTRFEALNEDQPPTIYTPTTQKQQPWKRWTSAVIRSKAGDPMLLADSLRQVVWRFDARLPITDVAPMSAVIQESVSERRFNLMLLSAFAALAVVLAAVGVYGVLAHLVAQRSREIGVHMALGAQRSDIFRLMLRQGLPLIGWGMLGGGLGALCVTRVLRSLLYEVGAADPATFGSAMAGLALVGLLASFIPARRALRVDPAVSLRDE
ncbi:MAG TPA: ABC transporter permease [Candidatus Polarisedimenticolia bacterium]|nr:ABC transporter permease [Candidatus Polarisedimenticolia bacterium]